MIPILFPAQVTDYLVQLPPPEVEPDPQVSRGSAVKLRVADDLPHLQVLAVKFASLACLLFALHEMMEFALVIVGFDVH